MVEDGVGCSLSTDEGSKMSLRRSQQTVTEACGDGDTTMPMAAATESRPRRLKRRRILRLNASTIACAVLAGGFQTAMAQGCISLQGSTACPAFNASSISTDSSNVGFFPFLADVTDLKSFDSGLRSYISNGYAQLKYEIYIQLDLNSTDTLLDTRSY